VTEDLGIKLESIAMEDLGQAKKVIIDKDNTTIIEGRGIPRRLKAVSSNCARRWRTRRPTTTARSCRSGSPSWSAAWRSSRSAPPPKPR